MPDISLSVAIALVCLALVVGAVVCVVLVLQGSIDVELTMKGFRLKARPNREQRKQRQRPDGERDKAA